MLLVSAKKFINNVSEIIYSRKKRLLKLTSLDAGQAAMSLPI